MQHKTIKTTTTNLTLNEENVRGPITTHTTEMHPPPFTPITTPTLPPTTCNAHSGPWVTRPSPDNHYPPIKAIGESDERTLRKLSSTAEILPLVLMAFPSAPGAPSGLSEYLFYTMLPSAWSHKQGNIIWKPHFTTRTHTLDTNTTTALLSAYPKNQHPSPKTAPKLTHSTTHDRLAL